MKHKQTLRRGLGILFGLVLCLTLLTVSALAAEPATETADFTEYGNHTAALALLNAAKTGEADSTWDNDTKTLTLNGVNFTTTAGTAVELPNGATIVLAEGTENTITSTIASTDGDVDWSYGIYGEGDLTIEGSGQLTVTGGEAQTESYGIYVGDYHDADNNKWFDGNLTISGGTVKATGGAVNAPEDEYTESCGIHASGYVTIEGGTVKATGGKAVSYSFGIYAYYDVTISDGTVTANGGEVKGDGGESHGICAYVGDVSISGSTVTATGGEAAYSDGIYARGDVTIEGGTVTATGGKAGDYSYGIYAYGDVTIEGGTVTATGGEVTNEGPESFGIESYDSETIIISGGHVIAQTLAGKSATTRMALNMAPNLSGYTGYYWRTSSRDSFTSSADTEYLHNNAYTYVEFSSQNTVTTYTVTVQNNGNGSAAASPTTAAAGAEITLSASPKSGYHFKEWQVISGTVAITDNKFTMPASDVTVKAIFEADAPSITTYTVSFNANGGSSEMADATGVSGSYTLPKCGFTAPEGKQFKGWATSATGEVISGTAITVTEDTTLYAVWEDISATTGVAIDAANFPAETFRAYVSRNFDTDKDGTLSAEEIAAVTKIYCYQMGIASLKGVEYFTELDILYCGDNQLTELDVSKNEKLTDLECHNNQLTSLDLSHQTLEYTYARQFSNNTYAFTPGSGRTFDLSTLPGKFDASKASNWSGGSVSGTILTVNDDVTKVTYDYACGNNITVTFTLDTAPKHTVKAYGLYGGTINGDTIIMPYGVGEEVELLIGARDGYTLESLTLDGITEVTWNTEEENGQRQAFFTMPDNDVTVTVLWEKTDTTSATKTITLNATGGYVEYTSVETGEDGKLSTLPTPTRNGYTFVGWYRYTETGTEAVTTDTVFAEDTVLYAQWTTGTTPPAETTCTVTFDANGGSGSMDAATDVSGSYTLPTTTTFTAPSGKQFAGWATSANGEVITGTTITVTEDTTLYAVWAIPYGVTVNDVEVTDLNKDDVLGNGLIRYDPATNTVYEKGYPHILTIAGDGSTDVVLGEGTITSLTVTGAKNVKGTNCIIVKGYIACAGDVTLEGNPCVLNALTVTGAQNVTMTNPASGVGYTISGSVTINCSGNVIIGNASDMAMYGSLTVTGARDVTVTANTTSSLKPAIAGSADITCSGDVTISNTGGGKAVSGTLKYQNASGKHSYTVKTGDSLENLTDYATKEAGDTFTATLDAAAVKISVPHTAGEWQSDSTQHWQVCTDCGIELEREDHTFSGSTCTVCGYTKSSGDGSSSSGGSSSAPTYTPSVTQPENGTVTVSPKAPKKGDTVTITPKPEDGYTVEQILVTDKDGDPVEVINNGDGTYSFTQPAGKVNVEVTFMEDNSMLNFFVDVPAGAYYYDAVLWAAENGITGGVDDTHFAPNSPCTRAQIVTFLWRAAGFPEPENVSSFADVPADSYYAKAVAWAVENGITTGTGDGMFSPDATCTRAQAMAFIWRSQKSVAADGANPFTDVAADAYYADAVQWAVENGITNGSGDGTTFSPNANCTRAQIVTFLFRCLREE